MRERGDIGDGYYVRKSQLNLSYPVGGIRHGSSTLLLSVENMVSMGVDRDRCVVVLVYLTMEVEIWFFST